MNKSLSGSDILEIVNHKAKIMTYNELEGYDDIDDVLDENGCCIVLYETKKNYGHWVCILKRGNTIEHFDSYGTFPDDELKFVPEYYREMNYKGYPHLTALLFFSKHKYKIEYNQFKLQKKRKGVNTCGRWVAMRIVCKDMPIEKFAKSFLNFKNPDKEIVKLTNKNVL